MWIFKGSDEIGKKFNKTQMAKILGLHPSTVRKVFKKTLCCSKSVAYCITKCIDNSKEIEDFFERCD
jgi:hypothetical protein|nr:MAG TPA: bacterial regulatory protein [Caudoviricetes sp.]